MPCPFLARRAATDTAAIKRPIVPPVVFYTRIVTGSGQKSLDNQHAQTLAYLATHHPANLQLRDDSSEPAGARLALPTMCRRAFLRDTHRA